MCRVCVCKACVRACVRASCVLAQSVTCVRACMRAFHERATVVYLVTRRRRKITKKTVGSIGWGYTDTQVQWAGVLRTEPKACEGETTVATEKVTTLT